MYGGWLEHDQFMLPGFINRDSPQHTLAFGQSPGAINVSSLLALSGDASIHGVDDFIVAVFKSASMIAACPANASVGMNSTALTVDRTLQFILNAQSVCVPRLAARSLALQTVRHISYAGFVVQIAVVERRAVCRRGANFD